MTYNEALDGISQAIEALKRTKIALEEAQKVTLNTQIDLDASNGAKIRANCAILNETCVDCVEKCPENTE